MKLSKVALQLYTLRDFCGSAKVLATTLKKVKVIGYDAVEMIRPDFASNRELRKLADDHGLAISSIHESGDRLRHLGRGQEAVAGGGGVAQGGQWDDPGKAPLLRKN